MSPKNPPPDASAPLARWLEWLEHLHAQEIELGLDRVLIVYRRLLPQGLRGRVVTVGGTNGKGSTVHSLERLLRSEGCLTGAYTSPHIHRFNERIRVNGDEVDDDAICRAMAAVEQARGNTPLTYFEFTTLAAFWIFQQAGVAFPLLEVGLGGRLDAVNVVDPELAIITSVDLDHTQWLGEDRDRIGYEKAGILRPGLPAIFGDPDPPDSVVRQARAQEVALRVRGRDFGPSADEAPGVLVLDGNSGPERIDVGATPLTTAHQIAAQAFRDLGFPVDRERLEALRESGELPGRFECVGQAPEIILDVGHNPHAACWLAERLGTLSGGGRLLAVYAALSDKDVAGVASALKPQVDEWFLAGLPGSRGLSSETLSQRLTGLLEGGAVQCFPDVPAAVEAVMRTASPDDRILVFGSFHTVEEAGPLLESLQSGTAAVNGLHSRH